MSYNIDKNPISIKHSELKRAGNSLYKSHCPICDDGILLVTRDKDTAVLLEEDRCINCGQVFIYEDIQNLK